MDDVLGVEVGKGIDCLDEDGHPRLGVQAGSSSQGSREGVRLVGYL